jgi:hypothetical protein
MVRVQDRVHDKAYGFAHLGGGLTLHLAQDDDPDHHGTGRCTSTLTMPTGRPPIGGARRHRRRATQRGLRQTPGRHIDPDRNLIRFSLTNPQLTGEALRT